VANPLLALLAARALPQARQVVRAVRLADTVRDLREQFDDLEAQVARMESLDRRVTALEQRLEDLGEAHLTARRARSSKS